MKRHESLKSEKDGDVKKSGNNGSLSNASKRTSTVFGKVSKYRHLKGITAHKSLHIENVKNISRQVPLESEIFQGKNKKIHFSSK
jgi:coronin-7